MTLKTILTLSLAAACLTTATAKQRKKKAQKPAVVKIQPVPADTFSYAVGVAQAPSLKAYLIQREGVDSAYVGYAAQALREAATLSDAQIKEKTAYAAGLRIAKMNKEQVIPSLNQSATGKRDTTYADLAVFTKGLTDGLTDKNTISPDSAMKIAERQMDYFKQELKRVNTEYLVANAKNKDFKVTPSGLQYRVLKQGDGAIPVDTTKVEVNYEGKLVDGTVFDSSYKRNKPATFKVSQVIKGWQEALKLMPVGSIYELAIPYEIGYGERGTQGIPPYSTLLFKVELLSIKN